MRKIIFAAEIGKLDSNTLEFSQSARKTSLNFVIPSVLLRLFATVFGEFNTLEKGISDSNLIFC